MNTGTPFRGQLSEDQIADVHRVCDRWAAVALSTERCDRAAAENAVTQMYRMAGLGEPVMVWMESPAGGVVAAWLLQHSGPSPLSIPEREALPAEDQVRTRLFGQLRAQRWRPPGRSVHGTLVDGLVRQPLFHQLYAILGGERIHELEDELKDQLRDRSMGPVQPADLGTAPPSTRKRTRESNR